MKMPDLVKAQNKFLSHLFLYPQPDPLQCNLDDRIFLTNDAILLAQSFPEPQTHRQAKTYQ